MVEVVDSNTGQVFQELVDGDTVDDMAVYGDEGSKRKVKCRKKPLPNIFGAKNDQKDDCETCDDDTDIPKTAQSENCETVPIIDKETGKVIDNKTVCNEITKPIKQNFLNDWGDYVQAGAPDIKN